MSKKISRNDPCPCGSGKKYKRCCLGNKSVTINKTTPKSEEPFVSRLALMRFEQSLHDNPIQLEKMVKQMKKYFDDGGIGFKDFILGSWNLNKVRKMSTSEIIEKLDSMDIDFEIERFKRQAQNYISAIQLAEDHYYTQKFHAHGQDEDFIWLAIIELWNRIIPEQYNIEMIDDLMQEGYKDIENRNYRNGIKKWEKAWNMIISIVPPNLKSITAADEFIPQQLTQSIYNWCQDFEMELGNAGLEDDSFYAKRIQYCRDFCRIFPRSDELIIQNMLRAEAESYAAVGDIKTADKLFQGLITRFPNNVWGYIGWGDIHCALTNRKVPVNYDKAEKLYRLGLAQCNTEIDVINARLDDLENKRKTQNT